MQKPVSLTQKPCSTLANSSQPKMPRRKTTLNWHQEQTASNAAANYGGSLRELCTAVNVLPYCQLISRAAATEGDGERLPAGAGTRGGTTVEMLRSVCCDPGTRWKRVRHTGKVKMSPNGGSLPGSGCSPVKTQIWVQISQFARLCSLFSIWGGNSPWFCCWLLLFLQPMSRL